AFHDGRRLRRGSDRGDAALAAETAARANDPAKGRGTDGLGETMIATGHRTLDLKKVRRDFPMLSSRMNGHPLVYLDNAATAQKPSTVIERMDRFLKTEYANIHRGVYTFSEESTRLVDEAREKCR